MSLVVLRKAGLEGLEGLIDDGLVGVSLAGQHPDVLALREVEAAARVNDRVAVVVGVQHLVVASWCVPEEAYGALGTLEGGHGGRILDLVSLGIVLRVVYSYGAVSVESITRLLAVVLLPGHALVACLLVPETHVAHGVEVCLEGRHGAAACRNASVDDASEDQGGGGKGSCGLCHSRKLMLLKSFLILYYMNEV